jgi:poly(A) polymerase
VEPSILERSQHPISRRDIDPNVLKVLYRLAAAEHVAYLVGGSVRDLMMGRRPKDFDVATSAHPQEVRDIFRNSRQIGRRFRLIHVFFGSQNIEVATFRQRSEAPPDSADPMILQDNTFGTPEEDAFRRDFTVNSLFYDPRSFQVIDYTGGVADLEARLIRTVGEPDVRMREDPVRMIRAVRFAAKLGFAIEENTANAIRRHCRDLVKASTPRVVEEIFRTIGTTGAGQALMLMERLGLLEVLLEPLSSHLRSTIPSGRELDEAPAVRHLAALGAAIAANGDQPRPMVLACMFASLYLERARESGADQRAALIHFLHSRGFARGECEQMRLLLDSLVHMAGLSRHIRRIARRPYYGEARRLLEFVAPINGVGVAEVDSFLAELNENNGMPRRRLAVEDQNGSRRRRKRRRGGKRHRRHTAEGPVAVAASDGDQVAVEMAGLAIDRKTPGETEASEAPGHAAECGDRER